MVDDPDVEQAVRRVGRALTAQVDEVAAEVASRVLDTMPELGAALDERIAEETRDSGVANVGAMAAMLAYGIPAGTIEPPHGAVEFARALIRRGIELPVLLRAYRVGHAALADIWVGLATRELADDGRLLGAALRRSEAAMFDYLDRVCARLVEACAEEQERWTQTAVAARAQVAREVLGDGAADPDATGRALGYDLRRHHVALIVWRPFSEDDDLGGDPQLLRTATALAAHCGCVDPLLIPAGRGLLWAWIGSHAPLDVAQLTAAAVPDGGIRVAAGASGHGPEGFRASHRQAERVVRVAAFARELPGAVVTYPSVALLSTLCADHEQARAFAALELGPLLAGDARELRETLRVFLDTGSSHVRAARELGVHEKTVTYRVRRAERLLGHPVAGRRTELAAALLVASALSADENGGPTALSPGPIA